jgi:hypothetical protein
MERRTINNVEMLYTSSSFGFCALPTEVILSILEYTDLVTPTCRVLWYPRIRYTLPPRTLKGSWQAPSALFLVSRTFCAQARKVFFKHNQIVVWHHMGSFLTLASHPEITVDYAATKFFADVLTPASFRYLRHLELSAFTMIGTSENMAVEQAQSNWFETLRHVKSNGWLGNLRSVCVNGFWDDAPTQKSFQYTRAATAQLENVMIIRAFVREHIWSYADPECGPPLFCQQLLVGIRGQRLESQYSIRKKGEELSSRALGEDWDPIASRSVSWQIRDHDAATGNWADELQNGDWVEEAWVREPDQRYRKHVQRNRHNTREDDSHN